MVKSRKGFYIGDPCYVMDDTLYYGYWGNVQKFKEGEFDDVLGTGFGFAVHGTYFGDGCYKDNTGFHDYAVDSGTIAVISIELLEDLGHRKYEEYPADSHVLYFYDECEHNAKLDYDEGTFAISIDGEDYLEIYTGREDEDDEEDEDYE